MTETNGALHSAEVGQLAAALAAAQAEIEDAERDSDNPYYGSTYADLASVRRAYREPLSRHSLAIIQTTEPWPDGSVWLRTTLAHGDSGQWVSGLYPIRPMRQTKGEGWSPSEDPQSMVSAITYARRATAAAITGVAPATDDDDGNAATGRTAMVEPRADGSAAIVHVENKTGTSKRGTAWSVYRVVFDDGRVGTTFDATLAAAARNLMEARTLAHPVLERAGQHTHLVRLTPVRTIDTNTGEVLDTKTVLGKDGKEHPLDETLSEEDTKWLWAMARKHQVSEETMREILRQYGYESTKAVLYKDAATIEQALKRGGGKLVGR